MLSLFLFASLTNGMKKVEDLPVESSWSLSGVSSGSLSGPITRTSSKFDRKPTVELSTKASLSALSDEGDEDTGLVVLERRNDVNEGGFGSTMENMLEQDISDLVWGPTAELIGKSFSAALSEEEEIGEGGGLLAMQDRADADGGSQFEISVEEVLKDELKTAFRVWKGRARGVGCSSAEVMLDGYTEDGEKVPFKSPAPIFTFDYWLSPQVGRDVSSSANHLRVGSAPPADFWSEGRRGNKLGLVDFMAFREEGVLAISAFYETSLQSGCHFTCKSVLRSPSAFEVFQVIELISAMFKTSFNKVFVPSDLLNNKFYKNILGPLSEISLTPPQGPVEEILPFRKRCFKTLTSFVRPKQEEEPGMRLLEADKMSPPSERKEEELIFPNRLTNSWGRGSYSTFVALKEGFSFMSASYESPELRDFQSSALRGFGH